MSEAHAERAVARESGVEANPLRATLAGNRHRTAISRTDYSRPIRLALLDGVIGSDATVLDYGCGLGDDVRHLRLHGTESWGWDPVHLPNGNRSPAEVVNLGYVVNVIEGQRLSHPARVHQVSQMYTHSLQNLVDANLAMVYDYAILSTMDALTRIIHEGS